MYKIFTFINKIRFKKLKPVGEDEYGNKYYLNTKTQQRFCLYYKTSEPSKISPLWHGWMHRATDEIPQAEKQYSWQKPFTPNTTGTKFAYTPEGSVDYAVKQGFFSHVKKYTSWKC